MTAAEWLACTDPGRMLNFLGDKLSERKLRLFGCACCRRVEHLIRDDRTRAALVFAEQMADGEAAGRRGRPAVERAADQAWLDVAGRAQAHLDPASRLAHLAELNATTTPFLAVRATAKFAAADVCTSASLAAAYAACRTPAEPTSFPPDRHENIQAEQREQAALLRDIAGDPFRPVALDPAWLTPTAVAVARHVYDARAFHDLPVLADALQDAGCDDAALLEHCRGGGVHVRGCWAVDLLLGKR